MKASPKQQLLQGLAEGSVGIVVDGTKRRDTLIHSRNFVFSLRKTRWAFFLRQTGIRSGRAVRHRTSTYLHNSSFLLHRIDLRDLITNLVSSR